MFDFVEFSHDIRISHDNQYRNDQTNPQVIVNIGQESFCAGIKSFHLEIFFKLKDSVRPFKIINGRFDEMSVKRCRSNRSGCLVVGSMKCPLTDFGPTDRGCLIADLMISPLKDFGPTDRGG